MITMGFYKYITGKYFKMYKQITENNTILIKSYFTLFVYLHSFVWTRSI